MQQNSFSQNLANAVKDKGISQTALAKQLNTTQQTISRWLAGFCEPDINSIIKLCQILDITPNELFGFEN